MQKFKGCFKYGLENENPTIAFKVGSFSLEYRNTIKMIISQEEDIRTKKDDGNSS